MATLLRPCLFRFFFIIHRIFFFLTLFLWIGSLNYVTDYIMDVTIQIIYHFGRKWENNGDMQYVGGSKFKKEISYDIDRFGYCDIHDFYANVLKMKKFWMWFRMSNVEGDEGLVELLGDNEVMQMVECNKKQFFTNVYCVEEGDEIESLDELLQKLETNYLDEDAWSENDEDNTNSYVPLKVNMVTQIGEHIDDGVEDYEVNMVTQIGEHVDDGEDYDCEGDEEEDIVIYNDNDLFPVNNESEKESEFFFL
ncbi:hypothetical protein CASFOL_017927 [Castilleja foliolosa]|uniref:PB1-like domain-containing protein n=1 Tax=Castilleja foliolosa TaxID=1961234 RepID=A0ABD3D8B6_9LAMI